MDHKDKEILPDVVSDMRQRLAQKRWGVIDNQELDADIETAWRFNRQTRADCPQEVIEEVKRQLGLASS